MTALLLAISLALAQTPPAAPGKEPGGIRYLEVPIKGVFGEQVTAPGIREAFRAAKSRKASAVVFVFDTPGGAVLDAHAIAATIDKERGDLKCYAVITQAISAAVWPLSRCDRVFFAPGAAAGAAVAFVWDSKSGSAEVDAKFNAAITAQVSAAAESHGQSGPVYRAMMLKDARLYGWRDGGGRLHLGEAAPAAGATDVEQIDSENSVLAWTTDQASKYGFGSVLPSADPSVLGPILGAEGWTSAGDAGTLAMNRWAKQVEMKTKETAKAREAITKAREFVVEVAKKIVAQGKVAQASEPANCVKIYYRENSGTFTGGTMSNWANQTDKSVGEWNTFLALLADLQKAERRAAQSVDDFNRARGRELDARLVEDKPDLLKLDPVDHGLDVQLLGRQASETIAKLRNERSRNRL